MAYIKKDQIIEFIKKGLNKPDKTKAYDAIEILTEIEYMPTADVVEVKHGVWLHGNDGGAVYAKCSACGRKMNYSCYGYAYCAMCGARMDGKRRG